MERRTFLKILGVAPLVPVVTALAVPRDDELVMRGNQITMGGKNVFRVTNRGEDIHIQIGEPFDWRMFSV